MKKVFAILSLPILFSCTKVKLDDPAEVENARRLVEQGIREYKQDEYYDALESFKQAQNYPAVPEKLKATILINISTTEFTIGKYDLAIQAASKALKLKNIPDQTRSSIHELLGRNYYTLYLAHHKEEQLQKAISHFRSAISFHEENSHARGELKKTLSIYRQTFLD